MMLKNTPQRYGAVAQLLHWTIVVLIIVQFFLASKAESMPLPAKIGVLAQHKSVGMTIFTLAVLRLLWRLVNPVPPLPADTPRWQRIGAHISHYALYALILITPLLGWMMSSARNFPVSWFGLFTLPDLVKPDRAKFDTFHLLHVVLARTMACIALLHAAAALKHHFLDKDNVLRRMLPTKLKKETDGS